MDIKTILLGVASALIAGLFIFACMRLKVPDYAGLRCEATLLKQEVVDTASGLRDITIWDCGDYGCITSYNPIVFRYARARSVLILGEGIQGLQILGIVKEESSDANQSRNPDKGRDASLFTDI